MKPNDQDDKLIDPLESILDHEPGPLPIAPDGGFSPQAVGTPEPIPDATPETMVCLRGPCRHYYECVQPFDTGNPEGTLETRPIVINRACWANQGTHLDLTEELVFVCTHWHPRSAEDSEKLKSDRDAWFKSNPNVKQGVPDGFTNPATADDFS